MNKLFFHAALVIAGLLSISTLRAQDDSRKVKYRRELPRTRTVGYDSEVASLEGGTGRSLYFQPLREQWNNDGEPDNKNKIFSHAFTVSFAWVDRQIFVHIGSVSGAYEVIVNGKSAGYVQNGSSPAEFDITDFTEEGANILAIRIYADSEADILRARGHTAPEITGEVYVVSQPRVRIRDYVASTNFEENDTTLQLGIILKSHLLNSKQYRVFYKLLSPSGSEVASGNKDVEIGKRGEDTVTFFTSVRDARTWSHENPNLYTLLLKTQHEGRYLEYIAYSLALKTTGTTRDGKFMLNSREIPLSVAEYTLRGDSAATASKLRELKTGGYNMVVVKDYPQPDYFYSLCDKMGIYVCNTADINTASSGESRAKGGNPSNAPEWKATYEDRVLSMYYTSRNHPSVIMFSIAANSSNGYNLYESYLTLKQIERSRPVVYMAAGGEWNSDAVDSELKEDDPAVAASRMIFDVKHDDRVKAGPEVEFIETGTAGSYTVRNRAVIADFHGDIIYVVKQGVKKVAEGRMSVKVAPGSEKTVTIPTGTAKAGKDLKYEVELVNSL